MGRSGVNDHAPDALAGQLLYDGTKAGGHYVRLSLTELLWDCSGHARVHSESEASPGARCSSRRLVRCWRSTSSTRSALAMSPPKRGCRKAPRTTSTMTSVIST